MQKPASLYIVSTPIGNLGDMTLRAIEVLKSVDKIAAEDTRHCQHLLRHYDIRTPTLSLHDYNERKRLDLLISYLQQGQQLALISDAGTPLVSDPGYHLVRAVMQAGFRVVPVPGASALLAALVVSGLPTDHFIFEGFLPAKGKARSERLQELKTETRTIVLYESTHRILNLLDLLVDVFGKTRMATIAREITKMFETVKSALL